MLTRDQFRDAMLQARFIAALIRQMPLTDLRAAIEHAEAFMAKLTPEMQADRTLIEALSAAQERLGAAEMPKHSHSVETFDPESGDPSRTVFGQGAV